MLPATDQEIEREDIRGGVRNAALSKLRNSSWSALKEASCQQDLVSQFPLSTCRLARERRSLIVPRERKTPPGTKGMGGGYPREGMISRWIYCNENNDRERFSAVHGDAGDSFGSRS